MARRRLNPLFVRFADIGDSVEGYYQFSEEYTNHRGHTVTKHTMLDKDGQPITFNGTMQMNGVIKLAKKGDYLEIVFTEKLGQMHNYDVYVHDSFNDELTAADTKHTPYQPSED